MTLIFTRSSRYSTNGVEALRYKLLPRWWWSLFSEDDLKKVEKAPIKLDKYAMMLRIKYGYTHERARQEINRRVAELQEAK